jgi:transposase InsO family protein
VRLPGRSTGYTALAELARGTNAFVGSTKAKRSIANRPAGVLGRLRATRPGEYVVLDTTRLDVFAMEPVTCRWVQCELTVAMDLYSRCITGLRLTPVSTKAVDVAAVLLETVRPNVKTVAGPLPYAGVPSTVLVAAEKLVDSDGQPLLPSVAAETIIFDHGKIYVSSHVESVCARMGISLQPARLRTPTDKPVERWFRTLGEGLLAALPGYKGPDVHSRGEDVEGEAFYFLDELEAIVREWIAEIYHCRPHEGLCVPEVPGLELGPAEMFEHGLARAGTLRIPARPDLALEFLEVIHTSIQHYGVEVDGLRYNGDGLNDYRNRRSSVRGKYAGRWPIAVDPDDVGTAWFQDPKTHAWHALAWEHAPALNGPFSREAAHYARRLAKDRQRFPDFRRALADLLQRWGAGLAEGRTERRMAVRLSAERLRLLGDEEKAAHGLQRLATLQRFTSLTGGAAELEEPEPECGDDDEEGEITAAFSGETDPAPAVDEDAFYAGVWESR